MSVRDHYDPGNNLWRAEGVRLWCGPRLNPAQCRQIKAALYLETARQYPRSTFVLRMIRSQAKRRGGMGWRPVWEREGVTRIVHDVSHQLASQMWPDKRSHAPEHAALERHLIAFAIRRGYHKLSAPAPKPKAPRAEATKLRVERRAAQASANLKRAETRLKRAQTLVKKWRAKVRYYAGKPAA